MTADRGLRLLRSSADREPRPLRSWTVADLGIVNEAVEQIAFADRILLNKTDLVEPDYLNELELELKAINKNASIRRTV